jgi:16S rRNA (adenine1518-N6/adenine1519-N6)-dimethyltransferase
MPNKSLGQHWLTDREVLNHIANQANLTANDTVLEIGPGLGTLTSVLLASAGQVIAVEFDESVAKKLPKQFPGKNLTVYHSDILSFDLAIMPKNYKVVANIPYYITGKIIQLLLGAKNKPTITTLLVQKEVAERLAAQPGKMSILAISAQVFADVSLGDVVSADFFTPPPKVDSRLITLKTRPEPLVAESQQKIFFRLIKAGFSAKRKKLRSSLSGGLGISKEETENLLNAANIDPNLRAEDLSIKQWIDILNCYEK